VSAGTAPAALVLAAANHLLRQEGWPLARLRPFAGRRARLALANFALTLRIADDGSFAEAAEATAPDVRLQLPATALGELLDGPEALMAQAHVEGNAEFAEILGQVLRNLRWDIEDDLAKLIGDVPAHRLHRLARSAGEQLVSGARRLQDNVAEYLAQESGLLVPRTEGARQGTAIAAVANATDGLATRIARLEAARRP
jgi:ubiquinone biosynthesis protein UbiJ